MALVGHISGSAQSQSVIGVTGSVVFANQPQATFPTITSVGSDVVFFVSGTVGGKNVSGQKTVAVFGGDTVVSGSLTVGSGSVKITSNDIQFSGIGNRIQLDGSDLKFFDASNPSGFTLTSLGSGGGGGTGADPGASYIVVSTTASLPNERALTGGTGILTTDGGANGNFTLAINDSVVATVSGTNFTGGVTGTTLSMTGDITGSSLRLTGGELTTAQSTFNLLNATATTVNFAGAATTLNIGGTSSTITLGTTAASRVNIPGDLFVQGAVTSIETTNLRVEDSLVLINSGAVGASSPSAIAFASGSTVTNQSLIFGAGIGSNVLAAALLDTQNGAATLDSNSFNGYATIRAGAFQVGGGTIVISSSNGLAAAYSAQTNTFTATSTSNTFTAATSNFINSQGGPTVFQNGGDNILRVSGSSASTAVDVRGGGAGVVTANLFTDTVTTLNVASQGSTINIGAALSSTTFLGNVTASNFLASGDLAVNGGDITTNAATFGLVNAGATTVNFAGAAAVLNVGSPSGVATLQGTVVLPGSIGVQGLTSLSGSVVLGDTSGDNVTFTGRVNSNLLPSADVQFDLGSPTNRWANMYTGDLHLRNERGDWTIIEESDFLTITNNKNGKRYKFCLEEIG
jgi:hypothetical protein